MGDKVGLRLYKNQKVAIDYFRVSQASSYNNNNNNNNNYVSKTILFEGFNNNNNNWQNVNNSNAEVYLSSGNLYVENKSKNAGWAPTISKTIDTSRDYYITAQFKHVSGITNNGFGLVFNRQDSNNENSFFITATGSYIVSQSVNGNRQYLQNWTKSSSIKTGTNQINF
ncbi:MAG: hypothetical protein HC798_02570 [Polaribacter sp.]|nr:hypothetical protein [Polaribacter sp.]